MKFKIVKQEDRGVPIHRLRTEQYTTKKGKIKIRPVYKEVEVKLGKWKSKKVYDDLIVIHPGDLVITPIGGGDILWVSMTVRVLDRTYQVIRMDNTKNPIQFTLRSVKSTYEYPSIEIQRVDDVVDVVLLATTHGEGSNNISKSRPIDGK